MISVQNLCKTYTTGHHTVHAVRDVSFTVNYGERIGIAGGSGSGKSTVLKILAGLEMPTSGTVTLFGEDIVAIPDKDLYRKLQIMFQNSLSVMPPRMKIGEFLREPYRNFDLLQGESIDTDIEYWLKAVDLPLSHLSKYPHELSGGQLQRIALARIMSVRPELVLFDEPTSALDGINQKRVLNLLLALREEQPFGYVFVSHDIGLLQAVTDRILVMKDGVVVEDIASKHLLQAQHPYTQMLVTASQ